MDPKHYYLRHQEEEQEQQQQSVQPPDFNIIGSTGTNQLAEAIGSTTQEPIKAYVVSSEVTSAQELDRNIEESASI